LKQSPNFRDFRITRKSLFDNQPYNFLDGCEVFSAIIDEFSIQVIRMAKDLTYMVALYLSHQISLMPYCPVIIDLRFKDL
jgi:hypothetical protein